MTEKKNCWEVRDCGREPGGHSEHELGVCPAASKEEFQGVNHGTNGGRVCWAVAGTFCSGIIQGLFATKIESCLKCPFFQQVAEEEEDKFVLRPDEEISAITQS